MAVQRINFWFIPIKRVVSSSWTSVIFLWIIINGSPSYWVMILKYCIRLEWKIKLMMDYQGMIDKQLDCKGLACALTVTSSIQMQNILDGVDTDRSNQDFIREVARGSVTKVGYSVIGGILFYKWHLVLSRSSNHIQMILCEYHDGVMAVHSGILKMVKCIQLYFIGRKWRMMSRNMFLNVHFARPISIQHESRRTIATYSISFSNLVWDIYGLHRRVAKIRGD